MGIMIVMITGLQLLSLFPYGSPLPAGTSSTDPCENSPCGSGAECKSMGSIAICICPNDGKGDPFVACMKQEAANLSESSLSQTDSSKILFDKPVHDKEVISPVIVIPSAHSSLSAQSKNLPQIAASFNVESVHQPFSDINVSSPVDYHPSSTPSSDKSFTDAPQHRFDMSSTTTTTPSSFPKTSNSRPATISIANPNNHQNLPESHRIPIITQDPQNTNNYYKHDYTPRPMTSTVSYSNSNGGHTNGFGTLHEKTYYPFPDFIVKTSPYPGNRRDPISSHSHPTYATYEWSNAPPVFPTRTTAPYGHHGYHPNSYGFPENTPDMSPNSVMSGSNYNYNHLRNDISSSRGDDRESLPRIPDPMGIYDRCRLVNGIVVCADKNIPGGGSTYSHQPTSHSNSYGSHTYRDQDRDRYDEFSRMPISDIFQATSLRPTATYNHNYDNRHKHDGYHDRYQNNYGYHRHNPNDRMDTKFGYEAFPVEVPRATEMFIGDQSLSSSATILQSSNNDNLCKSTCGVGAICRVVLDRPVCGCPEKHTGDPSVRCEPIQEESRSRSDSAGTCKRHYDCEKTQVCSNDKCQDPCQNEHNLSPSTNSRHVSSLQRETLLSAGNDQFNYKASICGSNAQCLVVEHVPVCKCMQNYSGNPYVACVQ